MCYYFYSNLLTDRLVKINNKSMAKITKNKSKKVEIKNNVLNTRKQINSYARELFSKYSYLGVSMRDIARKLDITKGALYYHYQSKEEIYIEVLNDVAEDLFKVFEKVKKETNQKKKLFALINGYLKFGYKEKNFVRVIALSAESGTKEIRKTILSIVNQKSEMVEAIIKEILQSQKKLQKANVTVVSSMLISLMNGILFDYSILGKKVDVDLVSNQVITLLFD